LNWKTSPPREVWRTATGPAWSSFAYVSGRLFTQEQRGEDELISCYDASDGSLIWGHTEAARFTEVVSGPGPRATPTFYNGRVYAYGAKGILCALDAASGKLIWRRDLMKEVGARLPMWGFSSSPLVLGKAVIVHADGDGDNGLIAFDPVAGEPMWRVSSKGMNFSSAQPVELDGKPFAVFADEGGLIAIDPTSGTVAWKFTPSGWKGPAIVQMQQIDETSLIVPLGDGIGTARLDVAYEDDQWKVTERWSSNRLKPTFNDFVYHQGFLYGFDRNIFTCVDAENGNRKWKRGRYGFGQVVLLADRSQLIVAAENGAAVLLDADPSGHSELGSVKVVSGKTWNHPIVADGNLFLRNGSETVCLELVP
jgi:outer membrane protein assembly factor BamB